VLLAVAEEIQLIWVKPFGSQSFSIEATDK
jgi:hypothetical protein